MERNGGEKDEFELLPTYDFRVAVRRQWRNQEEKGEDALTICPYGDCIYEMPIWRNTLRQLYTRHCHIEDLKVWNPELAKELIEKKYVFKNGVKYKLTEKGSHVHMIPARLCQDPNPLSPKITEPTTEKRKAHVLGRERNQTRLLEVDSSESSKEEKEKT